MSDNESDARKEADFTVTPPSNYVSPIENVSSSTSPTSSGSPESPQAPPQRSKTAPPLPPPDVTSSVPQAAPIIDTSPPQKTPTALRRTSSALSTGSSSGQTAREKKRLRFTPMANGNDSAYDGDTDSMEVLSDGHDLEDGLGRRRYKGKGVSRDQADYLKSDPGTPNLVETADQIRRTLSMASLDHLLLLSQNQSGERERLLKEVSRAGKELVWRSENERKLFPRDAERAIVLAAKRGLRSFLLAFSTRAGVDVLLMLFRTWRKRRLRFAMIRHAIFGSVPMRFAAMIGTFTFLNTLTLHMLRLAPPLSYLRRRIRAGLFVKPSFGPPEREGPEGERRWQAAVAGAVASLALLWETQGRRTGVAQQMFVRGLQGSYNLYAPRLGVHIPHGDVLVFGLCCGQIMYAWLVSPETIPREYNNWILQASKVPEFAVMANRTMVRDGVIEPVQVQRALNHRGITENSTTVMKALLSQVQAGWKSTGTLPCEMVHPWCDSCTETNFRRFFAVFRFMLPVYGALHLIPTLVLRHQHVTRSPLKMLARVVWGITRSCSFLGAFVVIYQSLFCLRVRSLEKWTKDGFLNVLLRRKESFWMLGFSTCLSLLVEEKKRRAELAMYVLPRALESAWSSARKRAYLPIVPFGETILGAGAMAMVMDAYKHQPTALSGVVRRLLFQLVGPV